MFKAGWHTIFGRRIFFRYGWEDVVAVAAAFAGMAALIYLGQAVFWSVAALIKGILR